MGDTGEADALPLRALLRVADSERWELLQVQTRSPLAAGNAGCGRTMRGNPRGGLRALS